MDDSCWIFAENSLELMKLPFINSVRSVKVFACGNTESLKDDPYFILTNFNDDCFE